jgi:N-acetylmuramoyl-L-alanine amidase
MLSIKDLLSPNYDERPHGIKVDLLVFHYTGMPTAAEALSRLRDPSAKVSAHYFVNEEGSIYRLVPEDKQAWHAGISCWNGKAALNENSIGIEIVNTGHEFGYRPFPQVQMDAVLALSQDILTRHVIDPKDIVGHSDIAPMRKTDPGELFDWKFLAKNNIGVWPKVAKVRHPHEVLASPGDENKDVAAFQKLLSDYGYHIRVDGFYGQKTEAVIRAFKRHFIQERVDAFWDNIAQATLEALIIYCKGKLDIRK